MGLLVRGWSETLFTPDPWLCGLANLGLLQSPRNTGDPSICEILKWKQNHAGDKVRPGEGTSWVLTGASFTQRPRLWPHHGPGMPNQH